MSRASYYGPNRDDRDFKNTSYVVMDSAYRADRSQFNPMTINFTTSKPIAQGRYRVSLLSATIPPAFNQIQAGFSAYVALEIAGIVYQGNIPSNVYYTSVTLQDFLDTISNYMNTFPHGQTFSITADTTTNIITITCTSAFILRADIQYDIGIYRVLGFNRAQAYPSDGLGELVSPFQFNPYTSNYFFIDVSQFEGAVIHGVANNNTSINFCIPYREVTTGIPIFTEQTDYVQSEEIRVSQLSQLTAVLMYANGQPVNMQADWSIYMRLEKLD